MPLPLLLVTYLGMSVAAFQSAATPPDLASLIRALPTAAKLNDPTTIVNLSKALGDVPLKTVETALPALIDLTESPESRTRFHAVVSLIGLEGVDANPPRFDTERLRLLLPYVPRLAPRLFDPATAGACYLVFNSLAHIRPVSPDLSRVLLQALDDPRSTRPLPPLKDVQNSLPPTEDSMGAGIVAALLSAGASFHLDPVTHITEGSDTEEVQQAILRFLHRPDQTSRTIAETIRTIALAQPQNPNLNDDLLRFLDSDDPAVRMELLRNLTRLSFSQAAFASAKAQVAQMVSDPSTSNEFRTTASAILLCWDNNRHHSCQ